MTVGVIMRVGSARGGILAMRKLRTGRVTRGICETYAPIGVRGEAIGPTRRARSADAC